MINVVPFKASHLAAIKLQHAQMMLSEWVSLEQAESLESQHSYTALYEDKPVGMAGVIDQWQGRAIAWAFMSDMGPQLFLPVHRAVKHFLDGCYIKRIEMSVDCEFPAAHRWAKMLGFHEECPRMEAYNPDGTSSALYARIL